MTDAVSTGRRACICILIRWAGGGRYVSSLQCLHAFPEWPSATLADVAAVFACEVGHAELTAQCGCRAITARRFELVLTAPDAGTRHG